MFSDFHIHTNFSGDSTALPEDQIEQALKLGMKELCITDHHDYGVDAKEINFNLDLPSYFSYMKQLKERYLGKIQINIGIELGLQNHIKDYLEHLIKQYDFDFIIGSSHFIDGIDPYYPEFYDSRSEDEAYFRYFEVTLERFQQLDCYDVAGHIDYIVRYGPNKNQFYSYEKFREPLDAILRTLVEKGKGLECNTGGYKYGLGQPNPSTDILKRYRELGGEILTIGSDGHKSKEIGFEFDFLKNVLKDCGFRYYTVYHQRNPEFIKID